MLRNMPRNLISIRQLLDDYHDRHDEKDSSKILELLEHTKTFIAVTAPDYKTEHASFPDDKMNSIFAEAALGFHVFDRATKVEMEEAKEVIEFCRAAIIERLELLQSNNDKIFEYYTKHHNSLKKVLFDYNPSS